MKKIFYLLFIFVGVTSCKSDGNFEIDDSKIVNLHFYSPLHLESCSNFSIENFKQLLNVIEENEVYYSPKITFIKKTSSKKEQKKKFEIPSSTHSGITKTVGTYGASELKSDYDKYFESFDITNKYVVNLNFDKTLHYSKKQLDSIILKDNVDFIYLLNSKEKIEFSRKTFFSFKEFYSHYKKELIKKKSTYNILFIDQKSIVEPAKKIKKEVNEKKVLQEKTNKDEIVTEPEFSGKSEFRITKVNENINTIYWDGIANVKEYILEIKDENGKVVFSKTSIPGNLESYCPGKIVSSKSSKPLTAILTAKMKYTTDKVQTYSGFVFNDCK